MRRLIKRYESRKLYDTEESRYVSLEELAEWIRGGHEVEVVDNGTGADVTAQMLTQIILDEGRKGTAFLPSDLLHELVRAGQKAVESGVEGVQQKMSRFFHASVDRLAPVKKAREEMDRLRERLEQLEGSLTQLEDHRAPARGANQNRKAPAGASTSRRSRRKNGEKR
ncbi:MAG: polyhydroxyalkanoate synthesis regulator DNA-binding domain-containing protein [Thermoanaerobaculia bacterium]